MEENIKNDAHETELSEEELKKISGGNSFINGTASYDPGPGYVKINVRGGSNDSALCPYCPDTALAYNGTDEVNNCSVWKFGCFDCRRKFIKLMANSAWYEKIW